MLNKRKLGLAVMMMSGICAQYAQAFIGENIKYADEDNYPSVCEITVRRPNGFSVDGYCTGTLISPTKIYTATHCFGRNFSMNRNPVSIRCGGRNVGAVANITTTDSNDASLWTQVQIQNPDTGRPFTEDQPVAQADFSVVTLVNAVPPAPETRPTRRNPNPAPLIQTSSVVTAQESYFDISGNLKPGMTCTMMGYGYTDLNHDSDGNLARGSLVEAKLIGVQIQFNNARKMIEIVPSGAGGLPTSANPGDSGGPLFCKRADANPELVGVIVNYGTDRDTGLRMRNSINPTWLHVN